MGVEIGQAPAPLPDGAFGVDHRLPLLAPGVGVQSDDVVVRRADVQGVADLKRRVLVFRAIAVADGDVAGAIGPGDLQLIDIVAVDLVQADKPAVRGVVPIGGPVARCGALSL